MTKEENFFFFSGVSDGIDRPSVNSSNVLDIGGQECKAIALFDTGKVKKFEMNDRCAAGMIKRVSWDGPIVFTGGVAKNHCMKELLYRKLSRDIMIPSDSQLAGAYGAALLSAEQEPRKAVTA